MANMYTHYDAESVEDQTARNGTTTTTTSLQHSHLQSSSSSTPPPLPPWNYQYPVTRLNLDSSQSSPAPPSTAHPPPSSVASPGPAASTAAKATAATAESDAARPHLRYDRTVTQRDLGFTPPHMKSRRVGTNLDASQVDVRHAYDYVFRRPKPLQVQRDGKVMEITDTEKVVDYKHPEDTYAERSDHRGQPIEHHHHPNSLRKQRDRMDLFIDLVWVGIISNISEHYFTTVFNLESSVSDAVGEFVLLFVPAFRLWFLLQKFLNAYYNDDFFQRWLTLWIIILGLIWGNNAPFFLSSSDTENFLVLAYLLGAVSLALTQAVYSIWISWLRRPVLISVVVGLPSIALWIVTTSVSAEPTKIYLLAGAICCDTVEELFAATPLYGRLMGRGAVRVAQDARHFIKRYQSFFVIALGEGVILLIRQSPAGVGLTSNLGRAIQGLLIFFLLNWLYFQGDRSRRSIHPFNRRWWVRALWQLMHAPMYGALVLLSSGVLFLVQFDVRQDGVVEGVTESGGGAAGGEGGGASPEASAAARLLRLSRRAAPQQEEGVVMDQRTLNIASATVCIAIAVVLCSTVVQALCARSLDARGTLKVDWPAARMVPRLAAAVVFGTMWLTHFVDPRQTLGVGLSVLFVVMMVEQVMGSDRQIKWFEPKGSGREEGEVDEDGDDRSDEVSRQTSERS